MGLGTQTGVLADLYKYDEEGVEEFLEYLQGVNEILKSHGMPPHEEPSQLPEMDNRDFVNTFPASEAQKLRFVVAHYLDDPSFQLPVSLDAIDLENDPVLLSAEAKRTNHFLTISDTGGIVIPADFRDLLPLREPVGYGFIGSSYRMLKELESVAHLLGISLVDGVLTDEEVSKIDENMDGNHPFGWTGSIWLSFYEAVRLSIKHGTAMHY